MIPLKAVFPFFKQIIALSLIMLDSLFFLIKKGNSTKLKEKVLIVRLDNIGDFILWLDAAKDFKKLYPPNKFEVTLLINQVCAPIAKNLDYFDEVVPLNVKKFRMNLLYRYKALSKVRKNGYSTVIYPSYSRDFWGGDAIVRISGCKERIGFFGDNSRSSQWQRNLSSRWYTKLIQDTGFETMELIRNAQFMRELGLIDFKADVPSLQVSKLLPNEIDELGKYYVLFPGASWHGREWPVSKFVELANLIYSNTGLTGIVCGGDSEKHLGEYIRVNCDIPILNYAGLTSINELCSIIDCASLVITNETSALHIAAAVSTPTVCILGGGHYGRFMPYKIEVQPESALPTEVAKFISCFHCNWNCIYKVGKGSPVPCIGEITVDQVWNAVKKMAHRSLITK